jgi:hypothetical protein
MAIWKYARGDACHHPASHRRSLRVLSPAPASEHNHGFMASVLAQWLQVKTVSVCGGLPCNRERTEPPKAIDHQH